MMKNVILLLSSLAVLSGCGFAEDPLASKDARIKQARPNFPKPAAENGDVVVDVANFYTFKEGQTQSINIQLRPLRNEFDKNLEVLIDNLSEFPGATFDHTTNVFTWTPSRGMVVGDEQVQFVLRVHGFARHETEPNRYIEGHKNVIIYVSNDPQAPRVVSLKMLQESTLREDDIKTFEIVVEDMDGGKAQDKWPKLMFFEPKVGLIPIGHLMRFESVVPEFTKQLWTYRYRLDLRKQELTADVSTVGFSMIALGGTRTSAPVDFSKAILNKIGELTLSWQGDIPIQFDQENNVTFEIADPKQEAILNFKLNRMPMGSDLQCKPSVYRILCQFKWKPTGNTSTYPPRDYLEIDVVAKNRNPNDSHEKRTTFRPGYRMIFPSTPSERGEP